MKHRYCCEKTTDRFSGWTVTVTLMTAALLLLSSCKGHSGRTGTLPGVDSDSIDTVTVLYTADEHGWLLADEKHGGAALLHHHLQTAHQLGSDPFVILLSGGDMWTGPAVSTWFEGESMLHVMNIMGYQATAVGNHEFDFGSEILSQRASQASFPFLAANLRDAETNTIPEYASAWTLIELDDDLSVAVIGLASVETPVTTNPVNVADVIFIDYETAILDFLPEVNEANPDIRLIIGHICPDEIDSLKDFARAHDICLIGGGHCHELNTDTDRGVIGLSAGAEMLSYAWAEIGYNRKSGEIVFQTAGIGMNEGRSVSVPVDSAAAVWKARMDSALARETGFTDITIELGSPELANLITDSWLISFPQADIALTNYDGIRQDIPAGPITLETMVGVLPFANTIYEIELRGSVVEKMAQNLAMAGMDCREECCLPDGTELHPDSLYSVLTNSYMYSVSEEFHNGDPLPKDTFTHYRQPTVDYIRSLETSPEKPLSRFLDPVRRHHSP